MKKASMDKEEFYILTKDEYEELVSDKPKFTLGGLPVNIYIPLPERTCANWERWIYTNTGVIYKGKQITLQHLVWIKDLIKNKRPFTDIDVHFDGIGVQLHEIDAIIKAVEDQRNPKIGGYDRDKEIVL